MMDYRSDFIIQTKDDMCRAVDELGFLPLFTNSVSGFSVEEHVDPDVWFSDEPGPWEWKGPVIRETGCAYGKFFENKAVFISREWFTDFANYRRDGYDFDARFDEELTSFRDMELYDLLSKNAPVISKRLKAIGNYGKNGKKGFDGIMTRLQQQCYAVISDFTYETDRFGKEYGWGVAEYSTPEILFGAEFSDNVYKREPEESYETVFSQLRKILPDADETLIKKILK